MSRSVISTLSFAIAFALGSAPVWAQDSPDDPIGEDPQEDPLDTPDDEFPDQETPTTPEEDPFDETAPPPDQPVEPVEPIEPIEPVEPVEPIEPIDPVEPEAVDPDTVDPAQDYDPRTGEPLPPQPQPPPPQQPMGQPQQPMYQPANPEPDEDEGVLTTPMGMAISLGGGLTGFVDDNFREVTDIGGGWDLRLVTGTRLPVSLELAYFGSAQNIEALGLDDDAYLLSNGGEAALRLNFANFADTEMYGFQPYVIGGAALRYYSIVNESFNTSNINSDDTIFEVPVGGGISFRAAQLVLDVRGSYRFSFDEEIIDDDLEAAEDASAMDSWNVFLTGGVEF